MSSKKFRKNEHKIEVDENGNKYVTKNVIKDYTCSEEVPQVGEYWDVVDDCALFYDRKTGEYHSKVSRMKRVMVMGPSEKEGHFRVLGNGVDDVPRDKFYAPCRG